MLFSVLEHVEHARFACVRASDSRQRLCGTVSGYLHTIHDKHRACCTKPAQPAPSRHTACPLLLQATMAHRHVCIVHNLSRPGPAWLLQSAHVFCICSVRATAHACSHAHDGFAPAEQLAAAVQPATRKQPPGSTSRHCSTHSASSSCSSHQTHHGNMLPAVEATCMHVAAGHDQLGPTWGNRSGACKRPATAGSHQQPLTS
jgi:hypothetical protein